MIAEFPPEISPMPQGPCQLSYAGGSTSLDPNGFRVIGRGDHSRILELLTAFPSLGEILNDHCMIISAYPAALGIQASVPFVDTYLHTPTLIRSLRLAAQQGRNVVFAAQPLAGADLLLKMLRSPFDMPRRMLWAAGGYYFPASLLEYMQYQLAARGCELRVLFCYGIAEVGHTCFAATQRDEKGEPLYRLVAGDVVATVESETKRLVLSREGRAVCTGDYAHRVGETWRILNSPERVSPQVRSEIESWHGHQWASRTGYLRYQSGSFTFQLREGHSTKEDRESLSFHRFWERYGGSLQSKPTWQHFSSTGHRLIRMDKLSASVADTGTIQELA